MPIFLLIRHILSNSAVSRTYKLSNVVSYHCYAVSKKLHEQSTSHMHVLQNIAIANYVNQELIKFEGHPSDSISSNYKAINCRLLVTRPGKAMKPMWAGSYY